MSDLYRLLLLIFLFGTLSQDVWAQEAPPDEPQQTEEQAQTERIVEDRPPLYSIKRGGHPLTWLEVAFKPVLRSAEGGSIRNLASRKSTSEKTSGIRFGFDGAGSGSGFGPEVTFFHKNFLGRNVDVELPLLYTYKRYEVYQLNAHMPVASQRFYGALSFDLGAGYRSRPQDDFYGFGNDSSVDNETQFRTVAREMSAGLSAKLSDYSTAGIHGVYSRVGVTAPTSGVSAQDYFDSSSTPGLQGGVTLRSLVFSIGRDNQQREKNAFRGGADRLEVSFNDGAGGEFQYWRYRLTSQHFFPLSSDARKVIAVRALLETNQTTSGHSIPFFNMPALGSGQTLRGFQTSRFRDKTALALSLEYRYRIWPMIDVGLFVDEGQVAPKLGDLAMNGFHTGYGVRLFVWPKENSPITFDYGRSGEMWRFYVNFKPRF